MMPSVRILAMIEAGSVTGPAKNLLGFCAWLGSVEGARTGLRITIATFERDALGNNGFAATARAAGIETHVIRERFRFDPRVIPQLREITARARPDIIQTHNNKSHLLLKLLAELRTPRPWIAFHHGDTHTDLKQRVYNHVDRFSLPAADRVVTVCRAFSSRLEAFGVAPQRIRVLHNAATLAPVPPVHERARLRDRLSIGSSEAVILSIGRLSREKGHADLLRALAAMSPMGREWKLVLLGTGPEQGALERLASSLGIRERMVFAGFQPDVRPYYALSDLFVLPSHSEGSSNVLLEAMMAKVPLVATTAGGNSEIVRNDETGVLVPASSWRTLAGAIREMLVDRERAARLAEAAYRRAEQEFSVEQYRRRLCGVYVEALEQGKAGVQ
jgi:glycosyltransferase involved in cell wall biosynthesis